MDKQTERHLNKITQGIPEKLTKNLTRQAVDTEMEDAAKAALKDSKIDPKAKRKIEEHIDRGSFRQVETVENEKAIRQLDEYHTQAVREGIRSGRLKDPMKDPFYRQRAERAERIKSGKEQPRKAPGYSKEEMAEARKALDPKYKSKYR